MQQRESRTGPSLAAQAYRYLGVGLTWALSTLAFLFLGTRADAWLGTGPYLTLAGAFVGAAAGFYHMIHHLTSMGRGDRDRVKRGDR